MMYPSSSTAKANKISWNWPSQTFNTSRICSDQVRNPLTIYQSLRWLMVFWNIQLNIIIIKLFLLIDRLMNVFLGWLDPICHQNCKTAIWSLLPLALACDLVGGNFVTQLTILNNYCSDTIAIHSMPFWTSRAGFKPPECLQEKCCRVLVKIQLSRHTNTMTLAWWASLVTFGGSESLLTWLVPSNNEVWMPSAITSIGAVPYFATLLTMLWCWILPE